MSADFALLARAMGADGYAANDPNGFRESMAAAMASGRPSVIDVQVDESRSAPATGSWDLPPLAGPPPTFTPDSFA